jgi:predicted enzyme related to lactoylglutathione lyase
VGVELADAGALSSMNLFYFHNEKGGVSMKIVDKITMVHLVVRDMDAAKAFYTDVLGFEATGDTKWDGRSVFVVPPGDGTYVALNTMSDEIKPGIGKMFLSTPDVEAAYKEIKARASSQTVKSCLTRREADSSVSMTQTAISCSSCSSRVSSRKSILQLEP